MSCAMRRQRALEQCNPGDRRRGGKVYRLCRSREMACRIYPNPYDACPPEVWKASSVSSNACASSIARNSRIDSERNLGVAPKLDGDVTEAVLARQRQC